MPNYRSGFERTIAKQLENNGVAFEYETLGIPYSKTYWPDFIIKPMILEVKGELTPQDRAKMIAVKKEHPDMDIRMVFMNAENKLNRRSKVTYADWAEKNGFKWCNGSIPKEWLEEMNG